MEGDITRALDAIARDDPGAADQLLPLVYRQLRRLAAQKLAREQPGQTLDATALVHEAYLRLVGNPKSETPNPKPGGSDLGFGASDLPRFAGRGHFFAAAAEAMRRILVERARRKKRVRHGGGRQRVELDDLPADAPPDDLLALDDALTRLATEDPVAAKVVELRHFAGLGHEAIAAALGVTVYVARQKWTYARAWLRDALGGV
jgi:RNA polymerase sigma factor (sigma-70 family)